ncbi:hypothetical protein [uncultured Clostridium sp.]|nr:hypothetical protein [uncultured Clostridium sp.]
MSTILNSFAYGIGEVLGCGIILGIVYIGYLAMKKYKIKNL